MKKSLIKLFVVASVSFFVFGCNNSKNSKDLVDLKLNVEKGRKFDYLLSTHFDMNMDMMSQKITTTGDVDYGYDLVVDDVNANGDRMITSTIKAVKFKLGSMGMTMGYDSKEVVDTAHQDPMSSMFRKMFSSMIGKSFKMTITQKGEVKNLTGLTEMLDAMIAGMPGTEEEKIKIRQQVSQSFNSDQVAQTFSQGFTIYPDKPVKVGDSWTKNNTMGISGMKSATNITYTVKEVKSDEVIVDLKGTIISAKEENAKDSSATATTKPQMDLKGDEVGSMTINRSTGLPSSSTINMTMKGNVDVKGMKSPMDMTAKVKIESQ